MVIKRKKVNATPSIPVSLSLLMKGILAVMILSNLAAAPISFKRADHLQPILKGPKPYIRLPLKPVQNHKPRRGERLYKPIIHKAAVQYSVDPAIIKAIIMAESGYNPDAVSKRGAVGLMQLMPETADAMGVVDLLDPEHNINGGVKYFSKLMNMFEGDVFLALSAYNAGITKVKKYKGVPPFRATRYYVLKVLQYYQYYKAGLERKSNTV
jgi:soluble lytic murein transglycosylase-like protein